MWPFSLEKLGKCNIMMYFKYQVIPSLWNFLSYYQQECGYESVEKFWLQTDLKANSII